MKGLNSKNKNKNIKGGGSPSQTWYSESKIKLSTFEIRFELSNLSLDIKAMDLIGPRDINSFM